MCDRWKTAIFCKKSIFTAGKKNTKKELYDDFMDYIFFLNHFCCWLPSKTFTGPWQLISSHTEIIIPLLPSISWCWEQPTEFIRLRGHVPTSCKNILFCPWTWLIFKVSSFLWRSSVLLCSYFKELQKQHLQTSICLPKSLLGWLQCTWTPKNWLFNSTFSIINPLPFTEVGVLTDPPADLYQAFVTE